MLLNFHCFPISQKLKGKHHTTLLVATLHDMPTPSWIYLTEFLSPPGIGQPFPVCSWHCCLECTFSTFYMISNFTSFRAQLKCQPPWMDLTILPTTGHFRLFNIENFVFFITITNICNCFYLPLTCSLAGCTREM